MKATLSALSVFVLALALLAAAAPSPPAKLDKGPVGRYQIVQVETTTRIKTGETRKTFVRLDTATGDAWMYLRFDAETTELKTRGIPYVTVDGWYPIPASYDREATNTLRLIERLSAPPEK